MKTKKHASGGGQPPKHKKPTPFVCQMTMEGDTAVIDISGVIGWDANPISFCDHVDAAARAGCSTLVVRINSCGGYCYDGLAMGDKLRSCGMHTRGEVCGQAMSMASYILQCCEERVAHQNATIMVHQPSAGVYGTVDEIAEQARYLCSLRDTMFRTMAARCGTTGEAMIAAHATMKLYTAQEALAAHMLDAVTETDEAPVQPEELPTMSAAAPGKHGVVDYEPCRLPTMMEDDPDPEDDDDDTPQNDTEAEPDKSTEKAPAEEPEKKPEEEDAPQRLTREELQAMLAEASQKGAAAALAELGVPRDSLPGNAKPAASASVRVEYTPSQLAKLPAMQRLCILEDHPELVEQMH